MAQGRGIELNSSREDPINMCVQKSIVNKGMDILRLLTKLVSINENTFQSRFSVNIWCGVIGSQVIGPSALEARLTSECTSVSWKMSSRCGSQVTEFLNQHFQNR
jgi:hypothetical protein